MFRDCKSGGYNLSGTQVCEIRLNTLILLIAIAYTSAIIQGAEIKAIAVCKNIFVGSKSRVEVSGDTALFMWVYLDEFGSSL